MAESLFENKTGKSAGLQILLTGIVCAVLTFVFGFASGVTGITTMKIVLMVILFLCAIGATYFIKEKPLFIKNIKAITVVLFALYALIFTLNGMVNRIFFLTVYGIVIVAGIALYLYKTKQLTYDAMIILIIIASFVIQLGYVLSTDLGLATRQHDVYSFGNGSGHSGYIEYFYNYWQLPDFNPQTVIQFYHPPLHHFLAAIWLKLQTMFGMYYGTAVNGIQFLTLFYANCSVILSKRILEELGLEKESLLFAVTLVAFCPVFILFAGSINNDVLSVLFILAAILAAIKWNKSNDVVHLLQIALFIGLGMSTKASVVTIAFPIGLLMVYKLWNSKQRAKQIGQYALFAGIVFPLGLWWPIRNFLLFDANLSYVPRLSNESTQFVGYRTLVERFFPFRGIGDTVYVVWGEVPEYNIWSGLFKTSAFGEFRFSNYSIWADKFSGVLFACTIAICTVSFVCMLYSVFVKKGYKKQMELFVLGMYCTFVISYIVFCYQFPHTCTMNVRYVSPLVVIGAFFIGNVIKMMQETISEKHATKTIIAADWCGFALKTLVVLYCISSCLVYVLLTISK